MMTLKELKEKVEVAKKSSTTPKAAALFKADNEIVAKEVINRDTEITVFKNGYVLYKAANHATVFPLHGCGEYNYGGVSPESHMVGKDWFDNENWYVRLMLEGEDRISNNMDKKYQKYCRSYSAVAEDWDVLVDEVTDLEKEVTDREYVKELLELVGDRAAYAIEKYYMEEALQDEIAIDLDIKKAAVSKLIRNNIGKIRKATKIERKENSFRKK